MPGMDAQNGFGMPGFSFQKIGSNYCGSNALGCYLYYYDTATGTSGPSVQNPIAPMTPRTVSLTTAKGLPCPTMTVDSTG